MVEKEAETCHMIEAAEARALVEANRKLEELERKVQKRLKLLAYLSSIDYRKRHEKLRQARHQNSGSWIFNTKQYRKWLRHDRSAILFLYGIPGCGKSVLASTIIDALQEHQSPRSPVVYFYCDHADKRTLQPVVIFESLAHALLQNLEIPPRVEHIITELYGDGDRTSDIQGINSIVQSLIAESFDTLTLFIDGLDKVENQDRQTIHRSLGKLLEVQKAIKLVICSRDDDTNGMTGNEIAIYKLGLLSTIISDDISEYIRDTVHQLRAAGTLVLGSPRLENEIVDALISGAKGMFLWVQFQLDDICAADTDDAIRVILKNLPRDLSETYDRLLGRVQGEAREQMVRKMFEWLICSRRPLSLDELREAIAFTIDDRYWDASKIPNDMRRLIRACGNLVVIDEETQVVRFAHHTVEQYIICKPLNIGSSVAFSKKEAGQTIAGVCIAYLSFSDFETQIIQFSDTSAANMATIEKLASTGASLPSGSFANSAFKLAKQILGLSPSPQTGIDYAHYIQRPKPPTKALLQKYKLLPYVIEHWLHHTGAFNVCDKISPRTLSLLRNLLFHKNLPFDIFPYTAASSRLDKSSALTCELDWCVEHDYLLLIAIFAERVPSRIRPAIRNELVRYLQFSTEIEGEQRNTIDIEEWLQKVQLHA